MNRSPRVLLIGRHFWPHGSIDSAGYLMQLATGLRRRGLHVEVLTPRYASSWAVTFSYRDIRVHRPAAAPRGDWSMGRYVRHLTTWLRDHAGGFDVLLTDSGREEVIAAVEVARTHGCRSIIRIGGWGNASDSRWWKTSRSAKRCAGYAKSADRVITANPIVHRELIREGFDATRISRIEPGFSGGVSRTEAARRQARRALGAINVDLDVSDETKVALCAGRMLTDDGMQSVTKSVRTLVNRFHDLQFWFVGDGPCRESMLEYLRSEGVRSSIAMPGSFSDIEDVLMAADLFLQSEDWGMDYWLPAAISAELPLVMIDNEATRQLISRPSVDPLGTPVQSPSSTESCLDEWVHWYKGGNGKSMREAIKRAMGDLTNSRRIATDLRRLLLRHAPLDQSIDRYAGLINETMARSASSPGPNSMGAVS